MATSTEPVTPQKQTSRSAVDTSVDSPVFARMDCSPETKEKLMSLKRKASEDSAYEHSGSFPTYLKWRLMTVETSLQLKDAQICAIRESSNTSEHCDQSAEELMKTVRSERKELYHEKTWIMSEHRILRQDLADLLAAKVEIHDAYISELKMSLANASSGRNKVPGQKTPRLSRSTFGKQVKDYLDIERHGLDDSKQQWCNVLGIWLPQPLVTTAHIIPHSWDTKEMSHLFGSDENPLTSRRNGLSLQKNIEKAFDDCEITIIPTETSVEGPVDWKIVLLDDSKKDMVFFEDPNKSAERILWRWRHIDGRVLQFRNDNRPARRFMYLRHALAYLHAQERKWSDIGKKLPPAELWATPEKNGGYLKHSVIQTLAKRIGDTIPKDLLNAGAFDDPQTSNKVLDEVAGYRIAGYMEDHVEGIRDPREGEDDSEEEDEEGDIDTD